MIGEVEKYDNFTLLANELRLPILKLEKIMYVCSLKKLSK